MTEIICGLLVLILGISHIFIAISMRETRRYVKVLEDGFNKMIELHESSIAREKRLCQINEELCNSIREFYGKLKP